MTITYHWDIGQYSVEWDNVKCGVLSASKIEKIITPSKMKFAENDGCRDLVDNIACQRLLGKRSSEFLSYDMRRGLVEEETARDLYSKNYAPVKECGFITNNEWGFLLGASPDGVVGEDGGIEVKSRYPRLQFGVIRSAKVPDEFRFQVQTTLLITKRPWWDFISYAGGMNMLTIRVEPDKSVQDPILEAATIFEERVKVAVEEYGNRIADKTLRILPTPDTIMDFEVED
jgi:hypothetical protein